MDYMKEFWNSIVNLYARFGLTEREVPILDRQRIFMEEVTEFLQESTIYSQINGAESEPAIEEAVDVLFTTFGVLIAMNVSLDEVSKAMKAVIDKNNAKTHETHEFVAGKIRRRPN